MIFVQPACWMSCVSCLAALSLFSISDLRKSHSQAGSARVAPSCIGGNLFPKGHLKLFRKLIILEFRKVTGVTGVGMRENETSLCQRANCWGVLSTQTSGGLCGLTTQQEESQFFRSLIISRVCAPFLELLWRTCDNYERARSAHQLMFSQSGCLAVSHGELSHPPLRKLFATHNFLIAPILMTYL